MTGQRVGPQVSAIDQVSVGWLESALSNAGFGDPIVSGFSIERVGTGQAAVCCRIALEYDDPDPTLPKTPGPALPKTIVAKFPGENEASRRTGVEGGTYQREVDFYRRLRSRLLIRTPACYLAEIADQGPEFALLLEDLAPATQGDQIAGCTPELARAAVRELVGLHAASWKNPEILNFGPNELTPAQRGMMTMDIYRQGLPHFVERCAHALLPDEIALLERVATSQIFPSEFPMVESACLVHNDYRLDNLLIDERTTPPILHVVDWQTYSVGNPMRDVSYFMGGCLFPDVRREVERDIVREYHDRLIAAGIAGYHWDDCWSDYRKSSYHGLMNPMAAMIFVTPTERGDRLFSIMAQRHARQILELGADEFLT